MLCPSSPATRYPHIAKSQVMSHGEQSESLKVPEAICRNDLWAASNRFKISHVSTSETNADCSAVSALQKACIRASDPSFLHNGDTR